MSDDILTCTCCGSGVRDNAEENVAFGVVPYPHDNGYGMCRQCGGDDRVPSPPDMSEEAVRKRLGWARCMLVDARLPLIARHLKPENAARLERMSYTRKAHVVFELMRKGVII